VEFGQELLAHRTRDGLVHRIGVGADFAFGNSELHDRKRPASGLSRKTGDVSSSHYALGAYYTLQLPRGAYVDAVAQGAYLKNKTEQVNDSAGNAVVKEKAWRYAASLEAGVPIFDTGNWRLETQVQVSYNRAKYDGYEYGGGEGAKISGSHVDALRGRLGFRLSHTVGEKLSVENTGDPAVAEGKRIIRAEPTVHDAEGNLRRAQDVNKPKSLPINFYGLFNFYHDFMDAPEMTITDATGTTLKKDEEYAKLWGEIGFGVQAWMSQTTGVFFDLRYQRAFGTPGGEERDGGSARVAVRWEW
jgi:autotransporter family porin